MAIGLKRGDDLHRLRFNPFWFWTPRARPSYITSLNEQSGTLSLSLDFRHATGSLLEVPATTMVVGDVIAIVQGSVALIRLIDDAFAFYKECRDLKARCEVVKSLLEDNRDVFDDNQIEGLDGLKATVQEARKYLENKKTGWLYRNPFAEKIFFLRLDKFEKKLDSGIITLNLAISVSAYVDFSNCVRKAP